MCDPFALFFSLRRRQKFLFCLYAISRLHSQCTNHTRVENSQVGLINTRPLPGSKWSTVRTKGSAFATPKRLASAACLTFTVGKRALVHPTDAPLQNMFQIIFPIIDGMRAQPSSHCYKLIQPFRIIHSIPPRWDGPCCSQPEETFASRLSSEKQGIKCENHTNCMYFNDIYSHIMQKVNSPLHCSSA